MLIHPNFDPIAFSLGPLAVRWYGLMYLVGFAGGWALGAWRIREWERKNLALDGGERKNLALDGGERKGRAPLTRAQFDDLLFSLVLGVILGGRLGYVLFYKPGYYFAHPAEILAVWQGGMSFHGGFLGVLIAATWFAYRHRIRWLALTDFIAPLVPLGIAAGRLGNFINGELWGRPTGLPWGTVFANADALPRHPSQLYQFALEGVALFALLWWFSARPRPAGQVSALFLMGYGTLRFVAEFAREPDAFLGLLAFDLSMGQWLSLPMVAIGAWLFIRSARAAPR